VSTIAYRAARLRSRWPVPDVWSVAALPLAVAAGWLLLRNQRLVEAVAILLLSLPLLMSARVRVVFLLVGTVTVFGSQELNTAKLLFVFGATVAAVGAFGRSRALVMTAPYADLRPLLNASFALLLLIGLSYPVSQLNGVSTTDWIRDVAPYVLLAWAPLFALDAQSAFSVRVLRLLIAFVGVETAIFFMARWYGRRDIAGDVTGGEFGLPSFCLAGALFAFAMAVTLDGNRGRAKWFVLGLGVFAMMVSTGTRLSAVLLAAPLAVVVGSRRRLARRSLRFAFALPIAVILVVIGARALLDLIDANSVAVANRYELLFKSGTDADQSYRDRVNQTNSAWELFRTNPVLGVGPGYAIPWEDANGLSFEEPLVDTPVSFLTDYGLLGLAIAGYLAGAFVSVVRRLRRRAGDRTTAQLALVGFGAVVLAFSVAAVPFEDKGLSVGLLLLLALSAREAAERWNERLLRASR
jgi:O-antigen ligase